MHGDGFNHVIPELARQSASTRRRADGNRENSLTIKFLMRGVNRYLPGNPFGNGIGTLRPEFHCKPARAIWINQKIIDRRFTVPVHSIAKDLLISAYSRNMSSIRGIEFLHDLLNPIHMLDRNGIRDKTSQVRNGPPRRVDLLPE